MLTVIIYFSTYLPWLPSACLTGGAIYMALRGMGFSCMYSCCYRGKLRQQYSLPGTDCYDCLIHCFCERCSLCQMHRELKNRGFNMEIGVFISLLFRSHLHTLQQAPLPPSPPPPSSQSHVSASAYGTLIRVARKRGEAGPRNDSSAWGGSCNDPLRRLASCCLKNEHENSRLIFCC